MIFINNANDPSASAQVSHANGVANSTPPCSLSPASSHLQNDLEPASRASPDSLSIETARVLKLAAPLAITNLCAFGISLVTLAFVGRLGQFELSVATLSITLFNVTGMSLLMGFNSALEAFCGQAYGAGNYRGVGIALQRALILNSCLCCLICLLWSYADSIFLLLGQDPAISAAAGQYLRLLSPALWLAGTFEALKRYETVHNNTQGPFAATGLALGLAPLYNWALIKRYGLDGAAYALVGVEATMTGCLVAHSVWMNRVSNAVNPERRTFIWSRDAFKGWGEFISMSWLSLLTICAEWWSFEFLIIMSGWLPAPQTSLAAMGICINISAAVWMVITGLGLACSTRVSITLGAGDPATARIVTALSLTLAIFGEIGAGLVILVGRRHIAGIFTNIGKVIDLVSDTAPVFVLSMVGDGANACLQGFLRGAGLPHFGAIINVLTYWVIGMPAAYWLGVGKRMGLKGFWWAMVGINTLQGLLLSYIAFCRMDFSALSIEAQRRGSSGMEQPLLTTEP